MQSESSRFEVFNNFELEPKSEVEHQKIIHYIFIVLFSRFSGLDCLLLWDLSGGSLVISRLKIKL